MLGGVRELGEKECLLLLFSVKGLNNRGLVSRSFGEEMFLRNPREAEMGPHPDPPAERPQMVENAGARAVGAGWARLQQQLARENTWSFWAVMEQLVMMQSQANMKLWEDVAQSLEPRERHERGTGSRPRSSTQPAVRIQKMTPADDLEAYLNTLRG